MKQFTKYLFRWQLSTPILAVCVYYIAAGVTMKTVIANLIGGCVFFFIDKHLIFGKEG